MSVDYEDFRRRFLEERSERRNGQRPRLEALVQASVAVERLTGHPEWDYFLSLVQAEAEAAQARRSAAEQVLLGPECDPEKRLAARLAYAESSGTASALERVLDMPRRVREAGEDARERLVREEG